MPWYQESGQDVSSRFGPQQTGRTIIEHVRPVDLQASMAQGAEILERWAQLLSREDIAVSPIDFAAELAYGYIDASYRSTDSREPDEQGGLPGVTREYRAVVAKGKWGAVDYVNAGIEGYGWGALSVHLLLLYLLGLREKEPGSISIVPALPQMLRRQGATYRVAPVPWGKHMLDVECTVLNAQSYAMRVHCFQRVSSEEAAQNTEAQPPSSQQFAWEGRWGEEKLLQLP